MLYDREARSTHVLSKVKEPQVQATRFETGFLIPESELLRIGLETRFAAYVHGSDLLKYSQVQVPCLSL
jgi:hypothetical protein